MSILYVFEDWIWRWLTQGVVMVRMPRLRRRNKGVAGFLYGLGWWLFGSGRC